MTDWKPAMRVPDPAVRLLDERFRPYVLPLAKLERLATGCRWAEGPVWFGDHRTLVWSDIPNDRMLRWIAVNETLSVFRQPSNYANGNTRDQGGPAGHLRARRPPGCPHRARRRPNRTGRPLPGQAAEQPQRRGGAVDGSVWFSDPASASSPTTRGSGPRGSCRHHVFRVARSAARRRSPNFAVPTAWPFLRTNRCCTWSSRGPSHTAGSSPTTCGTVRWASSARSSTAATAPRTGCGSTRTATCGAAGAAARDWTGSRLRPRLHPDRPHRPARAMRQPRLRRPRPQPPVPGRPQLSVRSLRQRPRRPLATRSARGCSAALADALTPSGETWSYAGNILAGTATELVLNQKRGQILLNFCCEHPQPSARMSGHRLLRRCRRPG